VDKKEGVGTFSGKIIPSDSPFAAYRSFPISG
jgi:hypothetical protein